MPVNILTSRSYRAKITTEALRKPKKPDGFTYNKAHAKAIQTLALKPEWEVLERMLEDLSNPYRAYDPKAGSFDVFKLHECAAILNLLGHIKIMCQQAEELKDD